MSAADQKPSRIALTARSGLEPHPRGYPQPDCRPGAGSTGTQPAGTGGALHGRGKILCLRGFGLSVAESDDLITSPAYIVIKAAEAFKDKTTAPNQLWQIDFTYLKITGWGWYYLSTVLDDFSRFIVAWKLCATMQAKDVTATLDLALATSGLDQMTVVHRPRLLSDNGASYVAEDLAAWLNRQKIEHVRGAPYHPQTQGKIERWHQTLKNRILLEQDDTSPAISNARSPPSWRITTMPAITRASTISPRLTSILDAPTPSSSNAKGSSARQSQTVACSTTCMPHNLNHR